MYDYYNQPMAWGMHFMGPIFWFFIIIAIVLLVRWLMKSPDTEGKRHEKESALDIVNKRYANGEIDRETYMRIKKDLET